MIDSVPRKLGPVLVMWLAVMWLPGAGPVAAQHSQPIRVRVEVQPKISSGLLRPGELPKVLDDELSAALADSILGSGRWSEFCWRLMSNGELVDAELRVLLRKDRDLNWEMAAQFSAGKQPRIVKDLVPNKTVLTSQELNAFGRPSRADLQDLLPQWFAEHYLTSPHRESLHSLLCKLVPVGDGQVSVVTRGNEKLSALYLPQGLEYFRDSVFKFVCRINDEGVGFKVRGTGFYVPAESSLIQLAVRPEEPLPAAMQGGEQATVYLVQFVLESDLGEVPTFQ